MITAIVRFPLTPGTSLEEARALYEATAPRYKTIPGLQRKYYLYGDDAMGGGVYLWESREAADALYTPEWRGMIEERFGTAPEITYYEAPVIVENQYATADAAE
jgi:hypothetical protein